MFKLKKNFSFFEITTLEYYYSNAAIIFVKYSKMKNLNFYTSKQ